MFGIFSHSKFNGDISQWKPYKIKNIDYMFKFSMATVPYWANIEDLEKRRMVIDKYHLAIELNNRLNPIGNSGKKPKI